MPKSTDSRVAFNWQLDGGTLRLEASWVLASVNRSLPEMLSRLHNYDEQKLVINLEGLQEIDSAGVAALDYLRQQLEQRNIAIDIEGGSGTIRKNLQSFHTTQTLPALPKSPTFFEKLGENTWLFFTRSVRDFIYLSADIFYWALADIFGSRFRRKGSFVEQAVQIGANALPIVGLMSFLIGLVLALQSAAQLREFGANIFIVDLIVIAMMREMGPLITAIIVAGRSGSAIASEIATMKVTEELDALTTMGLNPIRFVVVPKMQASVFTMPMLTVLATVCGIFGGMVVALAYLDISPLVFLNRMNEALYMRDLATGFIKSLVFAGLIVYTGSFFGFRVEQGAEGVGRVTTSSVVVSISLVIVADSILGLIFY